MPELFNNVCPNGDRMISRRRSRFQKNRKPKTAPLRLEALESRFAPSAAPTLTELGSVLGGPLTFEPNQGQTDASVQYLARGQGYSLFLTGSDAVLTLVQPSSSAVSGATADLNVAKPLDTPAETIASVVHMQLVGANSAAQIVGLNPLASVSNYFLGNDPSRWMTGVANYGEVQYQGVYSGINLTFHGNPTQLQYDFHVAAGADPSQIKLSFQGADQL